MFDITSINLNYDPLIQESKFQTVQKIKDACTTTGFFSISNHGVPIEVLDSCLESSIKFFRQSESEKMKVGMPFPGYPYGFVPMEQETLARSKGESAAPDLKESFSIGPGLKSPPGLSAEEAQFVFSENQWPENPKDFKNSWEICYKSLSDCSDRVMKLLALALNLPENWFEGFFLNPISAMRVNFYPELVKEPQDNQLRASAHSDYGSLTLLLQDEGDSGLEILNRDNEWISVKPSKPDLVVNIGDLMERWTNGLWVSSLHRVRIPKTDIQKTKSRMSLAFFQQPDWDARIECIPSCLGSDDPKFKTVTSGRHLMECYKKTVLD